MDPRARFRTRASENNSRGRRRFAPRRRHQQRRRPAEATAEAPAASDPWGVANVVEEASAEAEAEAEAGRRRRRATRERTRRGGRNRTRTRRRGVQGTRTSRDDASRVRIYGGRDASREENSRRGSEPGPFRRAAPTSAEHAQNRISDDPSSDPASASLVERFVHWYGNEGARAPDRRRRRRHGEVRRPCPVRDRASAPSFAISPSHRRRARVGDPLKMAADKLAYARALGPAALSYLAGFTPGDPGWRGDANGGDGGDGGGAEAKTAAGTEAKTAAEANPSREQSLRPDTGGGVETVGGGAAARGSAASVDASASAKSRYPPRNPDPVPSRRKISGTASTRARSRSILWIPRRPRNPSRKYPAGAKRMDSRVRT